MNTIRPAQLTDIPTLLAIEQHCFSETGDNFSAKTFHYFIKKSMSKCIIIEENKTVCGYSVIMLRKNSKIARIYSIAVNPHYHGKNLGQGLLAASEKIAQQAKRNAMILEVRKDNFRAQNFYKKNGYVINGEYKSYYDDGSDAFRMKKNF